MDKNKEAVTMRTTRGERVSYATYFAGQNIFFMLVTTYLSIFFLDLGIAALTVTTMLLAVKIWDAINDPLFGGIMDKVKLKSGKFIPWLRLSVILIPVFTVLIFAIPNSLPLNVKILWGCVAYILWDTSYTISDVPIYGVITRMSDNQTERMSILSKGRVIGVLFAMLTVVLVPAIRSGVGGWFPTVIIFTVIGVATMLPICFKVKERVHTESSEKDVSVPEMFRFVKSNKYLLIFFLAFFILQASNISMTLNIILARNVFGDETLSSVMQLMTLLPTIVLGLFVPKLLKRFEKFHLFVVAIIVNAAISLLITFVGYESFVLYLVLLAIKGIFFGMFYILLFMFTPDCVEYGIYKTGISAEGIGFSVQTFSSKLATAVASALGTFCLFLIGYKESEGAIQLDTFADQLWILYHLMAVGGAIIALLILTRYKLRDKDVQTILKANVGEITREEAEEILKGRI